MNTKTTLSSVLLASAIIFGSQAAWSDPAPAWPIDPQAYSHDATSGAWNTDWMRGLPDTLTISQLSLPGTHDSMAFNGGDIAKTQSMSLEEQLNEGIRVLDIRCQLTYSEFNIYHGPVNEGATFDNVLLTVENFLIQHPGETVFMRVKEENTAVSPTLSFAAVFNNYSGRFPDLFWKYNKNHNPTLGQVRGKVVLLQDFSADTQVGIAYNTLNAQDNYVLKTNWDLQSKWNLIENQIINASTGPDSQIYINYLSGSTGALPYFVASGKSSPGTHAPQLMTGAIAKIGSSDNPYPAFPLVNCLGKLCSIEFEGTNQLSTAYLNNLKKNYQGMNQSNMILDQSTFFKTFHINLPTNYTSRVGIIMADFPGKALINTIIAMNNKP